jgi:integrase
LRGELRGLIERRWNDLRLDCPYLFHREGQPIGDFRKAWRAACRNAGVAGRWLHDLRRSTVRNLTRAGTPEKIAMVFTGRVSRFAPFRYASYDTSMTVSVVR